MFPVPAPSVDDLLPLLARDVIEAIADRPHESEARRQDRAQCAMRLIEAFEPEDGVEIMLAGQTVLMQNLLLDAVHDARRAATMDNAHRHRQQAMSMCRIQLSCLKEISSRRADCPRPMEEAPALTASPRRPAEAPSVIAPRQPDPQTEPTPVVAARPAAAQPVEARPAVVQPTTAQPIAAHLVVAQPIPPHGETLRPEAPQAQIRLSSQMQPSAVPGPTRPVQVMGGT
jgi:hypothetical protein